MIGTSVMKGLMSLLEKNSCKVGSIMFEWDLFTLFYMMATSTFNELRLKYIRFGKKKKILEYLEKKYFQLHLKMMVEIF